MQTSAPVVTSVSRRRGRRGFMASSVASVEVLGFVPMVAAQAVVRSARMPPSVAPASAGRPRGAAVSGVGQRPQSRPHKSPPNPALQPTGYSGLRPLPPSAELERWAACWR
jgi:hypothetical protein